MQIELDKEAATFACAVCGEPAPVVVWEHRLCRPCSAAWSASPTTDAEEPIGPVLDPNPLHDENLKRFAEHQSRRTAAWVAQQRGLALIRQDLLTRTVR